jgi:hypothetical protein
MSHRILALARIGALTCFVFHTAGGIAESQALEELVTVDPYRPPSVASVLHCRRMLDVSSSQRWHEDAAPWLRAFSRSARHRESRPGQ